MAEPHEWHLFDVEKGYECRQVTEESEENIWEIRDKEGHVTQLNDGEFEKVRAGDASPKGLR
jgi:hypothetical protein